MNSNDEQEEWKQAEIWRNRGKNNKRRRRRDEKKREALPVGDMQELDDVLQEVANNKQHQEAVLLDNRDRPGRTRTGRRAHVF